jgi:hypothetical protein
MQRVLKTFISDDGSECVEIVRRDDGLFSFDHYQRARAWDETLYWARTSWGSSLSLFDSAETAEREARGRIAWMKEQP